MTLANLKFHLPSVKKIYKSKYLVFEIKVRNSCFNNS